MTDDFDGVSVIITGASGGIGRATAQLFAQRGARLVLADLNGDAVAGLAAELGAVGVETDVSSPIGATAFTEAALSAHSRIDVLINCAGIEHVSALVDTDPADFDLHWAVNVRSAFLAMRSVLPHMYKQRSGAVVNTASVNGFIANPGTTSYTASKHAVIGLTKVAAIESGPFGVRVNAICPGPIDTPMLHRFATDAQLEDIAATHIPLRRIGQPREVAELIAFLASPRASYLSGESVRVDAGLLSGTAI